MKKRLVVVLVMVVVLMMTACGNSNNVEEPAEADNQKMENTEQTDPGEMIDRYDNMDDVKQDFQATGQAAEDVMLSCTGIVEDGSNEERSYEIQICRVGGTNYHLYFKLYDQSAMVQEIECPIEFDLMAQTIETPVIMTDIIGDGIKDFILN